MFEIKFWRTSSTRATPNPNGQSALISPYLIEVKDQVLSFFPKVKDKPLLTGRPLARSVSAMVSPRTTAISSSIFVTRHGEMIGTIRAPPYAKMGRKFGGFESHACRSEIARSESIQREKSSRGCYISPQAVRANYLLVSPFRNNRLY